MKSVLTFLLILISGHAKADYTAELHAFEGDGCTLFSEGTSANPNLWRHCCDLHDIRYWFGGTKDDELEADQNLKSCVGEVAGTFLATVMYTAIRAGHYSPIKNKYKWGWGWINREPWLPLMPSERSYITKQIDELNLSLEAREKLRVDYGL